MKEAVFEFLNTDQPMYKKKSIPDYFAFCVICFEKKIIKVSMLMPDEPKHKFKQTIPICTLWLVKSAHEASQ